MNLRPEEISSVIKEQIKRYASELEVSIGAKPSRNGQMKVLLPERKQMITVPMAITVGEIVALWRGWASTSTGIVVLEAM